MWYTIILLSIALVVSAACWIRADRMAKRYRRENWQERKKTMEAMSRLDVSQRRGGQYDALRGILNDTERELDQTLARLRSYKGWNGRYRRRIAALEAELADERGEV